MANEVHLGQTLPNFGRSRPIWGRFWPSLGRRRSKWANSAEFGQSWAGLGRLLGSAKPGPESAKFGWCGLGSARVGQISGKVWSTSLDFGDIRSKKRRIRHRHLTGQGVEIPQALCDSSRPRWLTTQLHQPEAGPPDVCKAAPGDQPRRAAARGAAGAQVALHRLRARVQGRGAPQR